MQDMPLAKIINDKIVPGDLLKLLSGKEIGGVVTFSGVVRETEEGKKLNSIYYEAEESMAKKLISVIVAEAISKFNLIDALAVHRTREVKVGETSVFIAACSTHRVDAFRGCEFIIDSIKLDVPIWKKDVFEEGWRWRSEKYEG